MLMDCDPETLNVTPEIVEAAIRGRNDVKAIVFVDVAGQPCDIDGFVDVGHRHGIPLIEDAAEAFGAGYRGKVVGGYDHTTVFSFHIAKQLTTVEGGAVVTNNSDIAAKARLIRSHGEGPEERTFTSRSGSTSAPRTSSPRSGTSSSPRSRTSSNFEARSPAATASPCSSTCPSRRFRSTSPNPPG